MQRRVDGRGGSEPREPPPSEWIPQLDALPPQLEETIALTTVTRSEPVLDRRRLLWRDSATILIFVVLALLVAQAFPPGGTGQPGASTEIPSGVVTATLPPGFSLPPGVTFGPIIDPSLGIDATPTPIPAITEAPTPTPGPTLRPGASPRPTPKPSRTPTPTAVPTDTPAPPQAAFNWSPGTPFAGDAVSFTSTSTGGTSWGWDFGDGGTSSAENPTHTYLAPATYTVRLTVTGPGGTDFVEHQVTVEVVPLPT